VDSIDIARDIKTNALFSRLHYRTGYRYLQGYILARLQRSLSGLNNKPDLIWVDGGQYFGPRILSWLKTDYGVPIILYNIDDPTGIRDSCQYYMLKQALSSYSLCVLVRQETALEVLALDAKKVLVVSRSFDEVFHCEEGMKSTACQDSRFVSFIGTNIKGERRDYFLLGLIQAGCPLRIFGGRWQKSRFWQLLSAYHVVNQATGVDYVSAIKSSVACLGFLSHQNRDLITTRSLEVPACSGLLCAELSSEHQLLYENHIEVLFWTDIKGCVQALRDLLSDEQRRRNLRDAGTAHVQAMGVGNEDICRYVLSTLG
jgi:hypothetical protein